MIEIDKDKHVIPDIPATINKYPYRTMEIGESFSVPVAFLNRVSSGKSQAGKRLNRKFSGKVVGDIYRVWRVA